MDDRKMDGIDPVFGGDKKGAETHQLVFDGSDGFMGDMIAEDGDGLTEVAADVFCRDIAGRVFVDKRKGVVNREAEQFDIVEAIVEGMVG